MASTVRGSTLSRKESSLPQTPTPVSSVRASVLVSCLWRGGGGDKTILFATTKIIFSARVMAGSTHPRTERRDPRVKTLGCPAAPPPTPGPTLVRLVGLAVSSWCRRRSWSGADASGEAARTASGPSSCERGLLCSARRGRKRLEAE